MDITQPNLDIIFRSADNRFQSALLSTETIVKQIATTIPMGTRQLTQGWLDRIPMMRKWTGNRVINNAVTHARPIIAEPYENTLGLDVFDVRDDQLGVFSFAVQMLGEAVAKNPDKLNWDFLQQAATLLGYDGVPVYSASHPLLGGVAGPLPVGAPTVQSNLHLNFDLNYDNFVQARAEMRSWVGADGAPMMVTPTHIMVPPLLEGAAKLILEADFLSNIDGNTTAPQSNTYKGACKIIVNPWASAWDENWWLLDLSSAIKPFADYQLDAPQFTYLTSPTDANVFMSHQFLYGAQARSAASETVWWLSMACTGEAAYIHS